MSRIISTGLDVGTATVRAVVSEYTRSERGAIRRIIGTGSSESTGLRHGYIVDNTNVTRNVRRALHEAQKSSKTPIQRVSLSIGGTGLESFVTTGVSMISRADQEITELDVMRANKASEEALPDSAKLNRRTIHMIPLSYKLDGKEVLGRVIGMKGLKLEVKTMFITTLEQHLADLIDSVESANVEVYQVVASPIASAVAVLSKTQRIAGCVLVDIGAETTSLIVYENDVPISLKIFPRGAHDITKDLALGLRISLEDAEKAKLYGDFSTFTSSKKKFEEIVSARMKDILDLVETHLKKIGKNGLLPAGIVLTGGGALTGNAQELAKNELSLPSRIGEIEINRTAHGQVYDPSWTVAYGLSLLGLSPDVNAGTMLANLSGVNFKLFKNISTAFGNLLKKLIP
jgi:cell division protein FtsA